MYNFKGKETKALKTQINAIENKKTIVAKSLSISA
jgi:hypothetical protein